MANEEFVIFLLFSRITRVIHKLEKIEETTHNQNVYKYWNMASLVIFINRFIHPILT